MRAKFLGHSHRLAIIKKRGNRKDGPKLSATGGHHVGWHWHSASVLMWQAERGNLDGPYGWKDHQLAVCCFGQSKQRRTDQKILETTIYKLASQRHWQDASATQRVSAPRKHESTKDGPRPRHMNLPQPTSSFVLSCSRDPPHSSNCRKRSHPARVLGPGHRQRLYRYGVPRRTRHDFASQRHADPRLRRVTACRPSRSASGVQRIPIASNWLISSCQPSRSLSVTAGSGSSERRVQLTRAWRVW